MNHKGSTLQLILITVTLIIASAILLYGWVFGSTLHARLQSITRMPLFNAQNELTELRNENQVLEEKIKALEKVVYSLAQDQTEIVVTQEVADEIPVPDYMSLHDITIDQKCFADPADLNQCVVFASAVISPTLTVSVKSQGQISADGPWDLIYEFENGGTKIAEFKTSTVQLFEPGKIATINYINNRDFSITTKIGTSDKESTYAFDGSGWIDYQKFKF